jgi:hypothetical protein
MLWWQREEDPKKESDDMEKYIKIDVDAVTKPSATTDEVLLGLGVEPEDVMALYSEVEEADDEGGYELDDEELDMEDDDEAENKENEEQVTEKPQMKPKAAVQQFRERPAVPAAVATGAVVAVGVGVALVRRLLRRGRRVSKCVHEFSGGSWRVGVGECSGKRAVGDRFDFSGARVLTPDRAPVS